MKAKVLTLILSAILFITMSVPVYADNIETANESTTPVYADGTEAADEPAAPVYTDDTETADAPAAPVYTDDTEAADKPAAPVYTDDTETADAPDIVVENTSGEFADDAISSIADPPLNSETDTIEEPSDAALEEVVPAEEDAGAEEPEIPLPSEPAYSLHEIQLAYDELYYWGVNRTQTNATVVMGRVSNGENEEIVKLVKGTDYQISYRDNFEIGTATMIVTGIGNYEGQILEKQFEILPNPINSVTLSYTAVAHDGAEKTPEVVVKTRRSKADYTLTEGEDYIVTYENNVDVGTATVTVTGINHAEGSVKKTFKIYEPYSLHEIQLAYDELYYWGVNRTQTNATVVTGLVSNGESEESVKLVKGTDYQISYRDNFEIGTATMIVTGIGNYEGQILEKQFEILPNPINSVTLSYTSAVYDGTAKQPSVVVKTRRNKQDYILKEGEDYTVSYLNNIDIGTAEVIVEGINHVKGKVTKTFSITDGVITRIEIPHTSLVYMATTPRTMTNKTKVYCGDHLLTKTQDYIITYENNVNAGTATIIVTGAGDYTGTIRKEYQITRRGISEAVIGSISSQTYTGAAIQPNPTVSVWFKDVLYKLTKGKDYTVTYSNNVKTGTATIKFTGIGNYTGTVSKTFTISKKNISGATVKLDLDVVGYNGGERTPGATVTMTLNGKSTQLTKGTDYTVSYSNNVNIGTATCTVTGKGNFTGTIKKNFTIQTYPYINYAIAIANDNSHGYRYDYGYGREMVEYDCASLIYWSLKNTGYSVPSTTFFTNQMYDGLKNNGWILIPYSDSSLQPGDIAFRSKDHGSGHAEIYIKNGTWVGARGVWYGNNQGSGNGGTDDDTGYEIAVYYNHSGIPYEWIARLP